MTGSSREQVSALSAIADVLVGTSDPAARVERVLQALATLVPCTCCAVLDDRLPGPLVVVGRDPALSTAALRADLERTRAHLRDDDGDTGPRPRPTPGDLSLPLLGGDDVHGVLYVARDDRARGDGSDGSDGSDGYDEDEGLALVRLVTASVGAYLHALHQAEQQRRAHVELQRAYEFQQVLVGIVSHDLRNPIHAIKLTGFTLRSGASHDPRNAKLADRIIRSAGRAEDIVRDLLDVTQARVGGGLRIERAPAELVHLVADTVDEHRSLHPARVIELDAPEGAIDGSFDGARVCQVIDNLVGNALRYSPKTTPVRVRVRGGVFGGGSGDAILEVRNQGRPIAHSLLPTLFDPFTRGSAQAEKSDGVGLGLYIVDQIVRAHAGSVAVTSDDVDGTCFRVVLPI